ncbi:hypothetical protein DLREEDagr8_26440 [Dongia sp. agr-C8]
MRAQFGDQLIDHPPPAPYNCNATPRQAEVNFSRHGGIGPRRADPIGPVVSQGAAMDSVVIPGLGPGIHAFTFVNGNKGVDAGTKSRHDGGVIPAGSIHPMHTRPACRCLDTRRKSEYLPAP